MGSGKQKQVPMKHEGSGPGKKPAARAHPQCTKRPVATLDAESFKGRRPSWRISLLEMIDPYGWHIVDNKEQLESIMNRLRNLETMTWSEILIVGKKQNHHVSRTSICRLAQQRLVDLNQDDVDEVVSLRVTGEARIWGIRENEVLKLLWWDPEHQICPSEKKHT